MQLLRNKIVSFFSPSCPFQKFILQLLMFIFIKLKKKYSEIKNGN